MADGSDGQEHVTRGIRDLNVREEEEEPRTPSGSYSSSSSTPSFTILLDPDVTSSRKRKGMSSPVTRIIEEESRVGLEFASMPTNKMKRSSSWSGSVSTGDSCSAPTNNVLLSTVPPFDDTSVLSGSNGKDDQVEPQVQNEELPSRPGRSPLSRESNSNSFRGSSV